MLHILQLCVAAHYGEYMVYTEGYKNAFDFGRTQCQDNFGPLGRIQNKGVNY